jgi:hypothetical protein
MRPQQCSVDELQSLEPVAALRIGTTPLEARENNQRKRHTTTTNTTPTQTQQIKNLEARENDQREIPAIAPSKYSDDPTKSKSTLDETTDDDKRRRKFVRNSLANGRRYQVSTTTDTTPTTVNTDTTLPKRLVQGTDLLQIAGLELRSLVFLLFLPTHRWSAQQTPKNTKRSSQA